MVQLTQIVTANASAFFLLLIVKLHMKSNNIEKGLLDARILRVMINLTMFQCFFDSFVFWIDGQMFPGARELNYVGNVIYYVLNGVIAYFWPLFAEYKLTNSYKRVKRLACILGIPLAISAGLIISSPVTGIIFTVSEDNLYARTDIFFTIPTIIIFVYVICGTLNIYINRNKSGKYMIFPAIYFVIPMSLAMLVQMFNYGISLIFIGIAIAITGVYLSTQSESAYIDQLCGVYNRRYYNDYMLSFYNERKAGDMLTGILIDMDKFKEINDAFGHDIGDKALMVFSSVLRKQMGNAGFVVRYGGDEFVLITKESEEFAKKVVAEITKEVEDINTSKQNEFVLAFSYGISTLGTEGEPEEFLKTMDSRMYEMKKSRK